MSQLDALRLVEEIRTRAVNLAISENYIRDTEIAARAGEIWAGPGADGGLVGDLWIQGAFASQQSRDSLGSLVAQGMFPPDLADYLHKHEKFASDRILFEHQKESVRLAATASSAGHPSLVITAGTGAGNVSGEIAAVQLNPPVAPNPVNVATPQLPEPILDTSQALGARVRWFEQAFEWENIAYVLYPYYWGRRSRWVPNMTLSNDDPEFLSFLQAGYARVVVPVRLGFERAVHFYLHTGLPWLGGDLPPIGDKSQNPLYLDVAEEIKNLTGGGYSGEIEIPVGDPWEYVLPTTLIRLNDDGTLPEWHREIPSDIDPLDPTYASDAPDGPWTWLDGPPSAANTAAQKKATKSTAAKLVKQALKKAPRGARPAKKAAKGKNPQSRKRA